VGWGTIVLVVIAGPEVDAAEVVAAGDVLLLRRAFCVHQEVRPRDELIDLLLVELCEGLGI